MKKIAPFAFALFSLLLFVAACKKDSGSRTPASVTGSWTWLSTYYDGPFNDSTNPLTPQNTGHTESLQFIDKKNWIHRANGIADDSGTYSLGHGRYDTRGMAAYEYDSVVFFKNGQKTSSTAYDITGGDTLNFSPGLQGLIGAGAKQWLKQ